MTGPSSCFFMSKWHFCLSFWQTNRHNLAGSGRIVGPQKRGSVLCVSVGLAWQQLTTVLLEIMGLWAYPEGKPALDPKIKCTLGLVLSFPTLPLLPFGARGCPVRCRVFSLYPLDASSPTPKLWQSKMPPDNDKRSLGTKSTHPHLRITNLFR